MSEVEEAARQHQRLLEELRHRLPDPYTELIKKFSEALIKNNRKLVFLILKEREIKAGEDWAWVKNGDDVE